MLSLEKCKALLNDDSMSEDDIEALRSALYDSAQLAFEVYWKRKNDDSKNPIGLLPKDAKNDKF